MLCYILIHYTVITIVIKPSDPYKLNMMVYILLKNNMIYIVHYIILVNDIYFTFICFKIIFIIYISKSISKSLHYV